LRLDTRSHSLTALCTIGSCLMRSSTILTKCRPREVARRVCGRRR
jgi:hypothetical protein